ncbi:MAG: hypothetical protein IJ640_01245 [Prevotella sp.]|nr:hypothetical protein [Prevotella sp.]
MRKISLLFAVILATAYVNAQKNMTLTDRECSLVAIAACEAKGDMDALKREVNNGFDAGLTVSEAKEALSQLYAYTLAERTWSPAGCRG